MNYNVNDPDFKNSTLYQEFLKENPVQGYLKIRASAARGAIPISGLKIVVSKNIEDNNVTFFEGSTNESGMIDEIILPAPRLNDSDLVKPNNILYDITATYKEENKPAIYKVYIYENVRVLQNITIVPSMNGMGGF